MRHVTFCTRGSHLWMFKMKTLFVLLSVAVAVVVADITSTSVSAGDTVCATTTVRARSTPSLSGSIVTTLSAGSCGTLYGGVLTADGYKWYELNYNGQRVWVAGLYLSLSSSGGTSTGNRLCHGDIRRLNPTGQSSGGVAASRHDIDLDLPWLDRLKSCYQQTADENCLQASVIAAVASRESRGGKLLESTGGYGDGGHGWGIMQCDIYTSGLDCKRCAWDSCCHIKMMTKEVLVNYMNQVRAKKPTWSLEQTLQGGVAAYNFGVSNVQTWGGLDIGSTGNDYSNDVIARAQYLLSLGWN